MAKRIREVTLKLRCKDGHRGGPGRLPCEPRPAYLQTGGQATALEGPGNTPKLHLNVCRQHAQNFFHGVQGTAAPSGFAFGEQIPLGLFGPVGGRLIECLTGMRS